MQRNSLYCKRKRQPVSDRKGIWSEGKRDRKENPFVNVYNLQIGDELCVPGFLSVAENAYTPYIVKKGETILDIANMHKTTVENLAKSNKKIREMTLPVGTVLLIDKAK